ncbi:MAG: arginine deiminase family protein [Promethearchaeati archaeon SRVP18_Atabeyarchaeia-1]
MGCQIGSSNTPHFTHAVVRQVADTLHKCVRVYSAREEVDISLARKQHDLYCDALQRRTLKLIRVPADNSFPDCVFVEDPAIVYRQNAVICRMGARSRVGEIEGVRKTLSSLFKNTVTIRPPATIEGGDVLKVDSDLFIGVTSRTNMEGVNQLKETLKNEECHVTPVRVEKILHFKSACSYIGDHYIVANPGYFDLGVLSSFNLILLPKEEAYAANCLAVNGTVFVSKGYPVTRNLIEKEGFTTEELDVSEFKKCEGSLTCLSILF